MNKHIALRRVYEITLRLVSILFAFELLFIAMYCISLSPNANQSFRQLTVKFENVMGVTVVFVCLILLVISLVLLVIDKKFPIGGFIISLFELLISLVSTVVLSAIELMVFKGVEVLI